MNRTRLVDLRIKIDALINKILALDMTNAYTINSLEKRVNHDLARKKATYALEKLEREYNELMEREARG